MCPMRPLPTTTTLARRLTARVDDENKALLNPEKANARAPTEEAVNNMLCKRLLEIKAGYKRTVCGIRDASVVDCEQVAVSRQKVRQKCQKGVTIVPAGILTLGAHRLMLL